METKCAKTHEALDAFIQRQRTLLTQTQSDIERLRKLRNEVISQPSPTVSNSSYTLDARRFHLNNQVEFALVVPQDIDWSVYEAHDPTDLQMLAINSRQLYTRQNHPYPRQRSELSDLQKLVKEARCEILDPVLAEFEYLFEQDKGEGPGTELDSEESTRERETIRKLKKQKIQHCGLSLLPSRVRGLSGVFIRRDLDDESVDVDISVDDGTGCDTIIDTPFMDIDKPATYSIPLFVPQQPPSPLTQTIEPAANALRGRRWMNKPRPRNENKVMNAVSRQKSAEAEPDHKLPIPPNPKIVKKQKDTEKPKPETYKQAWSISEQHLLEQLLEQIPEGEKNRWQKISRAMDGRRTPRQVASRVQKYFEKLKRFGIREGE